MTTILNNQYWAYGQSPDIRFTLSYDMQRSGSDMHYKFYWTFHSLNTPSSGFGWPIYATIALDGVNKLNGITLKGTSPMKWYGTEITAESTWVTVSNKESGTTSFKMTMFSGSGMERSQTWTSTLAVSELYSTCTVPDITLGSSVTVTINRAKSTYTHTVKIELGSNSKTKTGVEDSWTYTVPISWCSNLPNATSGTAKVYVTTYENGVQVGSTWYIKEVPAYVPSSVVPTLSVAKTAINGIGNNYLKGHSKLKLDATSAGKYGSTITDITFTVGTETSSGTATSYTSDILTTSGTVAYTVVVTDSRGRTKKVSSSITVKDYTPPKISSASVYRCLDNGSFSESGTNAYVKAVATYDTSISGNTLTLTACYKEQSAIVYSEPVAITNNAANVLFSNGLLLTKVYNVLITAEDSAGIKSESVATISTSANYMLTAKGKKFCFGGYVDETKSNGLQVKDNLHVANSAFIDAQIKYAIRNSTSLDNGTDLNTVTKCGRYHSPSSSYTFTNAPENGQFTLIVDSEISNCEEIGTGKWQHICQCFKKLNSSTVYYRYASTGSTTDVTWGSWSKMNNNYAPSATQLYLSSLKNNGSASFSISGCTHIIIMVCKVGYESTNGWDTQSVPIAFLSSSKRYFNYGVVVGSSSSYGPAPFSLKLSGTTCTLTREGTDEINYVVYGVK